jgi:hypothetical protein
LASVRSHVAGGFMSWKIRDACFWIAADSTLVDNSFENRV